MMPLRQNRAAIALFMMLGIILSGVALAQAPSAQKIEEKFKAADVNHDGKLTLEEAKSGMPRVAKAFNKIDVEKKGYITLEQLQAFADKH
jgi:Ca2+-binding EF-hand superfamily protein